MKNILIYIDEPEMYEFIHSFFRGFIKVKLTNLPDILTKHADLEIFSQPNDHLNNNGSSNGKASSSCDSLLNDNDTYSSIVTDKQSTTIALRSDRPSADLNVRACCRRQLASIINSQKSLSQIQSSCRKLPGLTIPDNTKSSLINETHTCPQTINLIDNILVKEFHINQVSAEEHIIFYPTPISIAQSSLSLLEESIHPTIVGKGCLRQLPNHIECQKIIVIRNPSIEKFYDIIQTLSKIIDDHRSNTGDNCHTEDYNDIHLKNSLSQNKISNSTKKHDTEGIRLAVIRADCLSYIGLYPYNFQLDKNLTLLKKMDPHEFINELLYNNNIKFKVKEDI